MACVTGCCCDWDTIAYETYGESEYKPLSNLNSKQQEVDDVRCLTCLWFVEDTDRLGTPSNATQGSCHKKCPSSEGFPPVSSTNFCGDYKLDVIKL